MLGSSANALICSRRFANRDGKVLLVGESVKTLFY